MGILEFSASLRGSKAEGAILFKIPSKIPSLGGAKRPKLGILDFYPRNSKFPVIPQLDWGISIRNFSNDGILNGILEFSVIRSWGQVGG